MIQRDMQTLHRRPKVHGVILVLALDVEPVVPRERFVGHLELNLQAATNHAHKYRQ